MLRSPLLSAWLCGLALALLLAAACGADEPETVEAGGSAQPGSILPLYTRGNCHTCHGQNLGGTALGPALVGLSERWDVEELVEYLLDPARVLQRTPHLREMRGLYAMRMPSARQAGLSREQIHELAAWLLAEDRGP